jgi:glycosyltransferase involved in cell wall biosynthesis
MTGTRPLVSALVPTFNGEAFVRRTLDALAGQTWPNLEILIGEDASTDGTLAIVEQFTAGRPNVRVLARKQNLGWLKNSNDLMANARGELLFFGFHDDVPEPNYVEVLVNALIARPDAVLSFSDLNVRDVDGHMEVVSFTGLDGRRSILSRAMHIAGRPDGWYAPHRGLFRASAYHRSGGLKASPKGEFTADWTWLLELSTYGDFVRVPEVLIHKHYQKTSLSRGWDYSARNFAPLRRFAAATIRKSSIPLLPRLALSSYIALDVPRRKRQLRQLLRRP